MTSESVTVPREPTEAMIEAGHQTDVLLCRPDARTVWTAMIAASPQQSPDETDGILETAHRMAARMGATFVEDPEKIAVFRAGAQQSPIGGEGWQDISTAPKDGTRFLAYGGGLDDEVETCSWSASTACWNLETFTADDTDDEPQGYCRPTHWCPLPAPPVPSVSGGEGQGSNRKGDLPTEQADGAAVADELTERLTKVAYATEFLDVRGDILALIERDRARWLDNIAVCELLAEARADLARIGGPDRPRR